MIKKAKPMPHTKEPYWVALKDIIAERKEWQAALDKEKARADVAKLTVKEFEEAYIDRGIEIEKEKKRADELERELKSEIFKNKRLRNRIKVMKQDVKDTMEMGNCVGKAGKRWKERAEKAEAKLAKAAKELERIADECHCVCPELRTLAKGLRE